VLLLFLVLWLYPVAWLVTSSFKPPGLVTVMPPRWLFTPTLENYTALFASETRGTQFSQFLLNSFTISLYSTALTIVTGTMAAFGLARFKFRGRNNLLFWILSQRMFPPAAIMIAIFLMFSSLRLIDTPWALVLPYTAMNLPFTIWLMHSFISELPVELEEAAMVDGASRLQALWRIVVPLVAPGLAAATVVTWILSWNEFLFALILTRNEVTTAPVRMAQFVTMYGVDWASISAAGTLMILPVLVLTFFTWRHMVRGLTFGAVKG
jgi:ABC-type glycerol-3-phosphate transport system permease component